MILSDVGIRSEVPGDERAINRVHERAFGRTNEGALVCRLRGTPSFNADFSLVAVLRGRIVGHILLYPVSIFRTDRGTETDTLALAPLGVEPIYQHQGIGGMLIRESLDRGRALSYASVFVLGHPDYYPRFGFKPASRWRIYPPFDVQDSHFMALELVPGSLSGISGTVTYPWQFDGI